MLFKFQQDLGALRALFAMVVEFCILLRRLVYPCRYFDLVQRFARPVTELSLIANTILDWIYEFHGFRLTSWNQAFLAPPFFESYARAVERRGSPLKSCFGIIDGTVRGICNVLFTTAIKGCIG